MPAKRLRANGRLEMRTRVREGTKFSYDVCLSFAGEDRKYVESVAGNCRSRGIRVFYDKWQEAELWGKDLYTHLDHIYRKAARYCVVFISNYYASKIWTNHERRSLQARALVENREYVLPARFDDTEMPGLPDTVHYIDLKATSPTRLAELIQKKLGPRPKVNFLPPDPNLLYKRLGTRTTLERNIAYVHANEFMEALKRMSMTERKVIVNAFRHACPAELPKNIHIDLDLLRRVTGFAIPKLKSIVAGLSSLGFSATLRAGHKQTPRQLGNREMLVIKYMTLSTNPLLEKDDREIGLEVVNEMFEAGTDGLCNECGIKALVAADFSQLSQVTARRERHRKRVPRSQN